MLCLLTFEISEESDGKNFYAGVHGILVLLVLKSSSLVRACISAGSVIHIVGAKVRKLLYLKVIWLDFGISGSALCKGAFLVHQQHVRCVLVIPADIPGQ